MMLLKLRIYDALHMLKWNWRTYTAEHSVTLTLLAVVSGAAISLTAIQFFEFII